MNERTCSVEACTRASRARGMCVMHYDRLRNTGTLHRPSPEEAFWSHVDRSYESGCWPWQGFVDPNGYGRAYIRGTERKDTTFLAHRVAYEFAVGPIAAGLEIDHLCRNRKCVNPRHLEAVTPVVNQLRSMSPMGINSRKTHCIRGHKFDPENTYVRRDTGARQCRTCLREADRRRNRAARVRTRVTP